MQSVILSAASSALTTVVLLRRRLASPSIDDSFISEWISAAPWREYIVLLIGSMFLFSAIRFLRRFIDEV